VASVSIRNEDFDYFEWRVSGLQSMDVATFCCITPTYYTGTPSQISDPIDSLTVNAGGTESFWTGYTSGEHSYAFDPGDTFTVYAYRYIASGSYWAYIGSATVNIPSNVLDTPTFSSYSRSAKSIYVAFTSVTNANRYFIQYYKDGSYAGDISGLTNPYYTFSNLTAGSKYKFRCYAYDSSGTYQDSPYSSFTIEILPGFGWNSVYAQGDTFDITATKWNEFIKCIKDTYVWKGVTIPRTLNDVSQGSELTASIFNDTRFCIGSLNPIDISDVSSGNTVYASYLNVLAQKLNGIKV
jgi:hypothetical protein